MNEHFQLLNNAEVEISGSTVKLHYKENPLADEHRYLAEVSGDPSDEYSQQLPVHKLRGISMSHCPNSFSLRVERPKARFGNVIFAYFEKKNDTNKIRYLAYIDYSKWDKPIALFTFIDNLANKVVYENKKNRLQRFI